MRDNLLKKRKRASPVGVTRLPHDKNVATRGMQKLIHPPLRNKIALAGGTAAVKDKIPVIAFKKRKVNIIENLL
jgi:hypothetical protein